MENESQANLPVKQTIEPDQSARTTSGFIKKNPVLSTIIFALVVLVAVYFWKDIEGKNKKAEVEKMATEQLLQSNKEMLKLLAKPLVWNIRTEMIRGNMEQVDIYMKEMVQEKNFQFIHLVGPDGKILISTNKKLEGQQADGMFDSLLLKTDSVFIINKGNEVLISAAPVMGFEKKLATIIINYTPVQFQTKSNKKSDTTSINNKLAE